MKVKFEEHYKNFYTVRDYEQAKAVIACEKDDSLFTGLMASAGIKGCRPC